jgi:hypothetical protein
MYTTCLHCHADLGRNRAIEHFAVGRRLAFDAAQGRLWVVCEACRRWNLTPIEERWEAIEECEREFSRTRMRASSDNIAVAKTTEGMHLVRVGAPRLPEFAAWRYGKSLHQRWRTRAVPWSLVGFSGYGLQFLVNSQILSFGAAAVGFPALIGAIALVEWRRSRVKVMLPDGQMVTVRHSKGDDVQLAAHATHGWALRLSAKDQSAVATGTVATHSLRGALTAVNFFGGRHAEIADATELLAKASAPGRFIEQVAAAGSAHGARNLGMLPPEVRLALEMALQEDSERELLAGEISRLREEWRIADEVARIADDLLLPDGLRRALDRLKAVDGTS